MLPARCRLVDAAGERHSIAGIVGEHAELGVEVAPAGLSAGEGNAVGVARHADPDLQAPLLHQPGDDSEALLHDLVGAHGLLQVAAEAARQHIGQRRLSEQRVTVGFAQLRADQQSDGAAVVDEPRQSGCGRHERRRREVARNPVIRHGTLQDRHVESVEGVVVCGVALLQVQPDETVIGHCAKPGSVRSSNTISTGSGGISISWK